jgi:hypothetical protein
VAVDDILLLLIFLEREFPVDGGLEFWPQKLDILKFEGNLECSGVAEKINKEKRLVVHWEII